MPSVVLIDDSRDYCLLMERAFRRLSPGMGVRFFDRGTDAIQHLSLCGSEIAAPDLVLLDRVFPEPPTGFEVLRAARAMTLLDAVPIWMLSAVHEPDHLALARELGADAYLGKPTGDRCAELVARIMARQPWQREETVRVSCAPEPVPVRPVDLGEVSMTLPGIAEQKTHEFFAACRYAGIEPRHAMKMTGTDKVLDAKRRLVARWLLSMPMPLPWGTTEVREYLHCSVRYVEKCRAENERKPLPPCGSRALLTR